MQMTDLPPQFGHEASVLPIFADLASCCNDFTYELSFHVCNYVKLFLYDKHGPASCFVRKWAYPACVMNDKTNRIWIQQ